MLGYQIKTHICFSLRSPLKASGGKFFKLSELFCIFLEDNIIVLEKQMHCVKSARKL